MAPAPLLQDFGAPAPAQPQAPADGRAQSEPDRLAAWEQGYKAGWDDALRAEAEAQDRIGAEFSRTLQELSFTFHEARAQVINAMQPLLVQMTDTLFPGLAQDALAQIVSDTLGDLIAEAGSAPLELVLSPEGRPAVEARLGAMIPRGLRLIEEPTLGAGQAYLRLGPAETHIDVTDALERMRAALRDFYAVDERKTSHGR